MKLLCTYFTCCCHQDLAVAQRRQIVDEYIWPTLVDKESSWPKEVDLVSMSHFNAIWSLKQHIISITPKLCTVKELTKDPGSIIPVLGKILTEYEAFGIQSLEKVAIKVLLGQTPSEKELNVKLPKLFSLFPNPSLRWRFVHLNAKGLMALLSQSKRFGKTPATSEEVEDNSNYASGFQIFNNVFKLEQYGYDR
jgi:hypothetical protein